MTHRATTIFALAAAVGICACGGGDDPGAEAPAEPTEPTCQSTESGRVCVSLRGSGDAAGGEATSSDTETAVTAGDDSSGQTDGAAAGSSENGATGGTPPDMSEPCRELLGTVRDFKRGDLSGGHPDFEVFQSDGEKGIVRQRLGEDGRPVHSGNQHMTVTSAETFRQWYTDVEGVNQGFDLRIELESVGDDNVFGSGEFFPLDGRAFGSEGLEHNYGFTTELHTFFLYEGEGGSFTFRGDDDLWVFINGQLAIDLGGVHAEQSATLDLAEQAEALGLEPGNAYSLDLFHAERKAIESKFEVTTNLTLVGCR